MRNFCRCGHHLDEHAPSGKGCWHKVDAGYAISSYPCACRLYEEEDSDDRIVQGHVPDWIGRYGDGIGEAYRRAL